MHPFFNTVIPNLFTRNIVCRVGSGMTSLTLTPRGHMRGPTMFSLAARCCRSMLRCARARTTTHNVCTSCALLPLYVALRPRTHHHHHRTTTLPQPLRLQQPQRTTSLHHMFAPACLHKTFINLYQEILNRVLILQDLLYQTVCLSVCLSASVR